MGVNMNKEMYLDIIKFIVVFSFIISTVFIFQIISYLNSKFQYNNEIYLGELNKIQLAIEKTGVTIIEEHTLVKFEEVPIEEFNISSDIPYKE